MHFNRLGPICGGPSFWIQGEQVEPAPAAVSVTSGLWTPNEAVGPFQEAQTHLVCSTQNRASKSHAAYPVFPANAPRSLSRSTKPQRPAGQPGGSASTVPDAGPPRCRRAADRKDGAKSWAG